MSNAVQTETKLPDTAASKPAASQPAKQLPPLWQKPIPVLGLTGEYESGKTRFLLAIAPGPDTLIFDSEVSSKTYEEIGMSRVDIPSEMLRLYPNGYTQLDTFVWWHKVIRHIPQGQFRVIAVDVAEDIEAGLADWVWNNPLHFNHTRAQYQKMSGLFWADVKAYWKQILNDLQARCETFAFAVHLGQVWGGDNKPTGKTRPKGKSTLMELATLFLHLERPTSSEGVKQEMPSAKVLKTRLSHNRIIDGGLVTRGILPARLPEATPEAIRAYMAEPASLDHPKPGERDMPVVMSEDERAAVRLRTAEAEAETERLKLERISEERRAALGEEEAVEPDVEVCVEIIDEPTNGPLKDEPLKEERGPEAQGHEAPFDAPTQKPDPNPPEGTEVHRNGTNGQAAETNGAATETNGSTSTDDNRRADWRTRRPACLPPTEQGSIRDLFEQFAHLKELDSENKAALVKHVLKEYEAESISDLTPFNASVLEEVLVGKVREAYAERNMAQACPF